MGQLLHLHDAHGQTQKLLPWHVTGTLGPDEEALVSAHCADCAECRADLERETALREQVASFDPELEQGWARLRARIETQAKPAAADSGRVLRRPVPLGWALAAPLALAASAAVVLIGVPQPAPEPEYRLLGSSAQAAGGNAIVLFAPKTSEQELRKALGQIGARIVDGPTASGAYVIAVPNSGRDASLEHLRAMPQVTLAEPIADSDHR